MYAILVTTFLLSSKIVLYPEGTPPPPSIQKSLCEARQHRAFDQPDAAAQYYAMKRSPADAKATVRDLYSAARSHIETMPVYSTAAGSFLPTSGSDLPWSKAIVAAVKALTAWESVGPGNIGGRTRVLAINPETPSVMIAGGVSGGLWKTADGGLSWRPVGDDLANIAINSLAMDPADPDVLYAGTGEGYFREEVRGTWLPLRGGGIYKSLDGGESWLALASTAGEDFYWVNDLVVSPFQRQRIYAATRTGVWRSEDGGGSWQQTFETTVKGGCLDLAMRTDRGDDWLLASCGTLEQASVYRNTDAASSDDWQVVLSEPGMGRTSLAIAPSDQDIIYALSASNLPGPGGHFEQALLAVFRSDAAGDAGSWVAQVRNTDPVKLNTLLLSNPVGASYVHCGWASADRWSSMGWYVNVIAVDPTDPDTVWAAGVDLFRSDNGGRDWGLASYWWAAGYSSTFAHADQHAIVFHPGYDGVSNRRLYITNDGGIFVTNNALATVGRGDDAPCDPWAASVQWTALNHGYGVTQFYHGLPFPDGDRFFGGTQDNGTIAGSVSQGTDGWESIMGGDGGYVAIDPNYPTTIYAEYQWGDIQKSLNSGADFFDAATGLSDPGFLFITPYVMDPGDSHTLWTGGSFIWRTTNSAALWQRASASLAAGARVSALAVKPDDSNTVLAGTTVGALYRSSSALSAGASTAWQRSEPRSGFVSWIAFDPAEPECVYATYAGFGGGPHVWTSADTGATWTAIDGQGAASVPDIPVHCVVVDPTDTRRLFLGTDLGVLTSVDRGAHWAVENTGFSRVVTESLAIADTGADQAQLYAFTHGRGAWRVGIKPPSPTLREAPAGRIRP